MARTVAHVIVDALEELGVQHVFGVVGDALNPLTDAIRTSAGLNWIGCRHEEAAAFAASAQSQLSGTLGVCMGTVGPGSVHLLNGLYDAAKSRTPVLAICGQVPSPRSAATTSRRSTTTCSSATSPSTGPPSPRRTRCRACSNRPYAPP